MTRVKQEPGSIDALLDSDEPQVEENLPVVKTPFSEGSVDSYSNYKPVNRDLNKGLEMLREPITDMKSVKRKRLALMIMQLGIGQYSVSRLQKMYPLQDKIIDKLRSLMADCADSKDAEYNALPLQEKVSLMAMMNETVGNTVKESEKGVKTSIGTMEFEQILSVMNEELNITDENKAQASERNLNVLLKKISVPERPANSSPEDKTGDA